MKVYRIVIWWEILVFLLFLSLSAILLLYFFNGIVSSLNWKGVRALNKKDFLQAQTYFKQALIKNPLDPWSYMNLALSYDLLKSQDKALTAYEYVSFHLPKNISQKSVFYAYFNNGELNGRLGKLDKALKSYQKALDFKHKEEMIKTNIELLFKDQEEDQQNKSEEDQGKEQQDKSAEDQGEEQQDKSEKDQGEEQQDKSAEDQGEEQQDKSEKDQGEDQQDKSEEDQGEGQQDKLEKDQEKDQQGGFKDNQGQNQKQTASHELSEKEQTAILKEVEKKENEARFHFYKTEKQFNDKSTKDW